MVADLESEKILHDRLDLIEKYGKSARLLFALETKFDIDDIHSVANNSLTDGPDDKKCDLIYVNIDEGYAVIAQSYEADQISDRFPPSNKAADLNTAISWLFSLDLLALSDRIRPAANELHQAIKSKKIGTIYIWYVHNLNDKSKPVIDELKQVERTAKAAIRLNFKESEPINIHAQEIGRQCLEDWYLSSTIPILVRDKFEIQLNGGYEIAGKDWKSYVTSVSAIWLYEIYKKYETKLFSANIRDYLGSRKSDSNINYNIQKTAQEDPDHFWAYNNGLTGIVNSYNIQSSKKGTKMIIEGLSIVNGAQTTGAIGNLRKEPPKEGQIPIRFVMCNNNEDIINKIITYNNTQNEIKASDYRSNDTIQDRLRKEFGKIPNVTYLGGRRGGKNNAISRPQNIVSETTAAQALAAFNQDPILAYNSKSQIWLSDNLYFKYFNEGTHADHIIFVYSLLKALENKKLYLLNLEKSEKNELTNIQKQQLDFFNMRGSNYLLLAAISKCLESIINQSISNSFSISFGPHVSPQQAIEIWNPIIEVTTPFSKILLDAVNDGILSKERIGDAINKFQMMVESTKSSNDEIYKNFYNTVHIRN